MVMTLCQNLSQKRMNNRIFLYSSLFLVLILLFDASNNDVSQPVASSQPNIPETSSTNSERYVEPAQEVIESNRVGLNKNIEVTTDTLRVNISLSDGAIISSELLKYLKYFGSSDEKVKLLNDMKGSRYTALANIQSRELDAPAEYTSVKTKYSLGNNNELTVSIKGISPGLTEVIKSYTFTRNSHLVKVQQLVKNISNKKIEWRQYNTLSRGEETEGNGMLYTYTGAAYFDSEDKFNKIDFADIEDESFQKKVKTSWISMIQHYFFTAWLPSGEGSDRKTIYTRLLSEDNKNSYQIGSVDNYIALSPGESRSFDSKLYVGPKVQAEITDLAPGLALTVDYGVLTFLAAPLFWILEKIHLIFGNWGWSIIMLTILIKIVFFKLSEASYKSMAKMKKLTPRMNALKERYGDDKKKFSEALMKIYKEEKVNPLGGCLPILIQIPVFIALYWVIIESVEMRHAPFIGWIEDLSSADPLYILPVLMGVSMYAQQKLNPAPTDPMQAKIFLALPFVFTFLFATFPSGLVLYWVTNNLLSIAQQYVINKRIIT
jgi:YidC/Oxa1 family membrane protein insertase